MIFSFRGFPFKSEAFKYLDGNMVFFVGMVSSCLAAGYAGCAGTHHTGYPM